MNITRATVFPNLAKEFKTQKKLAELIHCSEKTVQRSMTGLRQFDEWEKNRIEEYTGLTREYLFSRRRLSKC